MDLTMGKRTVASFDKVFEYSMPRDEAGETVVPDTMPDIERILCADGTVVIRSKEAAAGSVSVTAGVAANVLYVPEGGGAVRSLSVSIPVSVTAEAPKVTSESIPVARIDLVSVEARMLNPRKVVVRAGVSVQLVCYDPAETEYTDALPEEGCADIETLVSGAEVSHTALVREKTFVVSDEYRLPVGKPPVGELLRSGVFLFTEDVKSVGSKLVVKGAARVQIVYAAAETGEPASAEFETSFSQLLDAERELYDPDASVAMLLTAVYIESAALPGGERGISCELHAVAQVVCTDRTEARFISDCYSNRRKLEITRATRRTKCVCRRVTVRATAHEQAETPQTVRDVTCVSCRLGELTAEGAKITGSVLADIVYCDDSGGMYSVARRMALACETELEEGCTLAVDRARCAEVYAIPAGRSVDVRICVDIDAVVTREVTVSQVSGIGCGENEPADAERPSVTVLRATGEMSLWALGKKYHSTRTAIRAANELEESDPIAGKILLIPCVK